MRGAIAGMHRQCKPAVFYSQNISVCVFYRAYSRHGNYYAVFIKGIIVQKAESFLLQI